MVMAQSLFMSIKRQDPDAIIDVLAPNWSRPIIERMPEVNAALVLPFDHGELKLKERKAFGLTLKASQYDQSILLPNSLKSALIPYWAGIPKRTGWRGEMRYGLLNDLRPLDKEEYPLMIQLLSLWLIQKAELYQKCCLILVWRLVNKAVSKR